MSPMVSYISISLILVGLVIITISLLALYSSPILIIGISLIPLGLVLMWDESSSNDPTIDLYNSWDNIVLMFEELNIIRRAVYLPSGYIESGQSMALVPLTIAEGVRLTKLPLKLSVRLGISGAGILLFTPGTKVINMCRDAGAISVGNPQTSLTSCLINHLALIKRVSLQETHDGFRIDIAGSRLRRMYEGTIVEKILGSPIASVVASVVAEALGTPVYIDREEVMSNRRSIYIVRLPIGGG